MKQEKRTVKDFDIAGEGDEISIFSKLQKYYFRIINKIYSIIVYIFYLILIYIKTYLIALKSNLKLL